MYESLFTLFSIVTVYCYFFLLPDPPPTCGAYSQPGKYYLLKYGVFRLFYWLRRKYQLIRIRDSSTVGYGVKSKRNIEDMERIQDLPKSSPLAVDAVYFNASDHKADYLMASIARRHDVSQTVFIIRLAEFGLLELPTLPETNLKVKNDKEDGVYRAGGLSIKSLEPMKRWKINFEGKLKLNGDSDRLMDVRTDLEWTSCSDFFDFDTDLNSHALSSSMAREQWTRSFFQRLRDHHQTHYEQFGDLRGTVTLFGGKNPGAKLEYKLEMKGVRDHSYGMVRDWSHFHRYAIHFVHTVDGLCFNAGVLSGGGRKRDQWFLNKG